MGQRLQAQIRLHQQERPRRPERRHRRVIRLAESIAHPRACGLSRGFARGQPVAIGCTRCRHRPARPKVDLAELRFALEDEFGPIDEVRQEASIGPLVSGEIAQQALLLLVLGSIGILGWMTFRFADFRMGMSAIAALVHDVIVVLGVFAILGTLIGLEIDALFVTAMLTVIGFSVHDTIVVFDRIRENRIRHAGEPMSAIVNHSLLQTLGRSLNTSLTVAMVLLALLLFGSDAIRSFVFAMVVGIISGTYSSIFNASMVLVSWHEWDERRRQARFATARR